MNPSDPSLPVKALPVKALSGADAALRRASSAAQALARRTGTPCWVRRDGRLVDLSSISPPEPTAAGPRKLQKGP